MKKNSYNIRNYQAYKQHSISSSRVLCTLKDAQCPKLVLAPIKIFYCHLQFVYSGTLGSSMHHKLVRKGHKNI